ncbi:MAG TPA: hypothetical protein VGD67_04210, partial [Pseudonocardiaceae bacterium]
HAEAATHLAAATALFTELGTAEARRPAATAVPLTTTPHAPATTPDAPASTHAPAAPASHQPAATARRSG